MHSTEEYPSNAQQDLQQAIQSGSQCYQTCMTTLSQCLSLGGEHANASHIQTMYDCAEICQLRALYLLQSAFYKASSACADYNGSRQINSKK